MAEALESCWGIKQSLQDLPDNPEWLINCTNLDTGKNWRFSKGRMGDWIAGYQDQPNIPIAIAIAASAGVPYAIGVTRFIVDNNGWYRLNYKENKKVHLDEPFEKEVRLWDGGVYENLGIESLCKVGSGFTSKKSKLLIISDAGMRLSIGRKHIKRLIYFDGWKPKLSFNNRVFDIASDQTRALRARVFVNDFQERNIDGCYIRIGNDPSYILSEASRTLGKKIDYPQDKIQIPKTVASSLANYPTSLHRMKTERFEELVRHGLEASDATLKSYCDQYFSTILDDSM